MSRSSTHYGWNNIVDHFFVCRTWKNNKINCYFYVKPHVNLKLLPVTEWSLIAVLHISILAECHGTYLSWVDPANKTCLNMCKFDLWDNWYMKVWRISVASFNANWCRDPDFFNFCMNHIPILTKPELLYNVPKNKRKFNYNILYFHVKNNYLLIF